MQPDDPHHGVAVLSYSRTRTASHVLGQIGRWMVVILPPLVAACFIAGRSLDQQATRIYTYCTALMDSPQFQNQQQTLLNWSRVMQRYQVVSGALGLSGAALCVLWVSAAAYLLYFYVKRRRLPA